MKTESFMRWNTNTIVVALAGLAAALIAFMSTAGADQRNSDSYAGPRAVAVFAGGCFWCVEADFEKLDGVIEAVSGYTGGSVSNPTYKQVTYGDTGHIEAVQVTYDPTVISYEELVAYYFRTIDPTDADGQFCDKGPSYRTAVFVANADQREIAEAEIAEINESGVLDRPVVTKVKSLGAFWEAEDYHQDYYIKSASRYQLYRNACGRDKKLDQIWGKARKGS